MLKLLSDLIKRVKLIEAELKHNYVLRKHSTSVIDAMKKRLDKLENLMEKKD